MSTTKKNAALTFEIGLPSLTDDGEFQTNPTIAAGDFQISKDGGSYTNLATLPTVIGSSEAVTIALSAAEMNADRVSIRCIDQTGTKEWGDVMITIITTEVSLEDVPTAAENRAEMDSNSTQLAAIVADTNELQTDDIPGLIAALNDLSLADIRTAVGLASANLDTQLAALPTAAENRAEMDSNSTQLAAIVNDTNELQTDDVPGLIAGLNDLGAADIRAAVGLASANLDTQLAALPTAAEVATEIADALGTDTYVEPTGVPPATATLAVKIGYLYMALRNQIDITSTKKTFYDDGGSAEWEKDLSDDGTTYSESEANAI